MAKRLRVNKKKWPIKSNAAIKSFHTKQRGHIFSVSELEDESVGAPILCMWKGHTFLAKDWCSATDYVYEIKEVITDY